MKARLLPLTFCFLLACAPAASARQAAPEPTHRLTLPGKASALDVALPGYEVTEVGPGLGAKSAFLSASRRDVKRAPIFVLQLSPARRPGGAPEFRDFAVREMEKGNLVRGEALKTWEYKQIPVARYRQALVFDPRFPGDALPGRTEAYFVRDDLWAVVGMLSQSFGADEERLFQSVLDSVRFTDGNAAPVNSFDYFHKGRALFKAADYPKAAEHYRAALELERRERRLAPGAWRTLVNELALAYGVANDFAGAKQVLEYGLASEPEHFWFNYDLARVHAAAGDADGALASLEKAAQIFKKTDRWRFLSGDLPPVPSKDPVFARLVETDRFKKAAKAFR